MPLRAALLVPAPAGRGGGGRGRGNGPGVGRGGAGRGQGRKAPTKGLGCNAALAVQASLSDLLGPRRLPAEEQVDQEATGELIRWKYNRHDGGDKETLVDQEQRINGKIMYRLFSMGRPGVLLAKGTQEDKYWVDEEDNEKEVPQDHERAREFHRGGKLKIRLDGGQEEMWVTNGPPVIKP